MDLKDLCEQIKTAFNGVRGARRILQACDDIITTLTDCVIKSGCSGFAYQRSYGLSVYFPWSVVCPDYRTLDFAKSSGWGTFLEKVVRETRRPPRFDEGLRRHDTRVVDALTAVLTQAHIEPLESARLRRQGIRILRASVRQALEKRFDRRLQRYRAETVPLKTCRHSWASGSLVARLGLKTAGTAGEGSRYTGEGSRYTGEGSRSPADREKSVKNLPAVIGKAFWPPEPPKRPKRVK